MNLVRDRGHVRSLCIRALNAGKFGGLPNAMTRLLQQVRQKSKNETDVESPDPTGLS
jgi:hypothetical protein